MKTHQFSGNTEKRTLRKNILLRVRASRLAFLHVTMMLSLSATTLASQAIASVLPCPLSNFSITSGSSYSNGVTCNINVGGTLNDSGWFVNNAMLNNNFGGTLNIINLGGLSNFGSLNNRSGATLYIDNAGLVNNSSAILTNSGTLYNNGGLHNYGSLTNSGLFTNNNGLLANYAGGKLTNTGVLTNAGTVTNAGKLSNTGTLSNAGTLTNTGTLTNSGTFNNDGTVNGTGTYNQTAGTTNVNGTTFTQNQININGGNLFGFGSINGNVANNGGIIQGGASGTAGNLGFNGGLTQTSTGTLQELITLDAGYSTIQVGGPVNLDGILNITTGPGFSFAAGQTYDIMGFTPGSLTGQFAKIYDGSFVGNGSFINIGGGLVIDAAYNNSLGNIQLLVSAVPEPQTYAMMLVGLALLGFTARNKRTI